MKASLTIVGGGLAGLALGIGLRRHGVPVVIHEARRYPRHRVCGEFINGRGLETLHRLGLTPLLDGAGAVTARTAVFFGSNASTRIQALPTPALCISRFMLDDLLAGEFRRLGGELREGERVVEVKPAEGRIRATGRRPFPTEASWLGMKVHARNVSLNADLEMHMGIGGYIGLCRLAGGTVNVCGLFCRQSGTTPNIGQLRGPPGSQLHKKLAHAVFLEESFCATAGLSLRPERATSNADFSIGDAITMIPPVTGNGMSMAFESAEWAIDPLVAWHEGSLSWKGARELFSRRCDAAFAQRLRWSRMLQACAQTNWGRRSMVFLIDRMPGCWRWGFRQTR